MSGVTEGGRSVTVHVGETSMTRGRVKPLTSVAKRARCRSEGLKLLNVAAVPRPRTRMTVSFASSGKTNGVMTRLLYYEPSRSAFRDCRDPYRSSGPHTYQPSPRLRSWRSCQRKFLPDVAR